MLAKSGDKTKPINFLRDYCSYKKKAIRIINFQPQTSPFNNLFLKKQDS